MQNKDKQRTVKMTKAQKKQHEDNMKLPINQYLNSRTEDGKFEYSMASELMHYYMENPDKAINCMRLGNAFLHEIRFHREMSAKFLYENKKDLVEEVNERGQLMSKEECYLKHIQERGAEYLALSKLRELLSEEMIKYVNGNSFTFEVFNKYLEGMRAKLKEMGHELFPAKAELIMPL